MVWFNTVSLDPRLTKALKTSCLFTPGRCLRPFLTPGKGPATIFSRGKTGLPRGTH